CNKKNTGLYLEELIRCIRRAGIIHVLSQYRAVARLHHLNSPFRLVVDIKSVDGNNEQTVFIQIIQVTPKEEMLQGNILVLIIIKPRYQFIVFVKMIETRS